MRKCKHSRFAPTRKCLLKQPALAVSVTMIVSVWMVRAPLHCNYRLAAPNLPTVRHLSHLFNLKMIILTENWGKIFKFYKPSGSGPNVVCAAAKQHTIATVKHTLKNIFGNSRFSSRFRNENEQKPSVHSFIREIFALSWNDCDRGKTKINYVNSSTRASSYLHFENRESKSNKTNFITFDSFHALHFSS